MTTIQPEASDELDSLPIKGPFLTISAYKFIQLNSLEALRDKLKEACLREQLKGTILLAAEGINMFFSGLKEQVYSFESFLSADPRFADLKYKESWYSEAPFNRMLVKIKKEIITMKIPEMKPWENQAPFVEPQKLKRWLDQGHDDEKRDIVMLDTRNRFEVEVGSFDRALAPDLVCFSEYPQKMLELAPPEKLHGKTIVTFCTGGIRCEKAAPWMLAKGYTNVFQIQGGILKYFEECGGAHFHGDCFVFDKRGALTPSLTGVEKNRGESLRCSPRRIRNESG